MDFFNLIRTGDLEKIKPLVEADKSLLTQNDERGFSPLVLATYSEQFNVTKYFIEAGAPINGLDAAGNTALMGVCFKGNKAIAQLLIDSGADVNIQNTKGDTALVYAISFDQPEMIKILKAAGANEDL